tara:strand:- start:171 stop:677 length:507 start_codon:yes stop_codon:yes gene_type:complete
MISETKMNYFTRFYLFNFILILLIFKNSLSLSQNIKTVRVIDGDTIVVNNNKIRLHGIDAPEKNQICKNIKNQPYKCGISSKNVLIKIIGMNTVNCKKKGRDRYKRIIGICFVDNVNVNQQMVKLGWALAYRKYSKDYIIDEKKAKRNKLGLWSGNFIKPWKWRKNKK